MATICAPATPRGVGGLSVIRVSGDKAVEKCAALVRPKGKSLLDLAPNTATFARIYDGESVLDEVMVTVFYAPRSFTGENTVEISCHGSLYVTDRVMELLVAQGCRMAEGGEFTKRAFLNGKLDLTQAEAVIDLINARSALQAESARNQLDGRLRHKVSALRDSLMELGTEIMAYVDYPDETIGEIDENSIVERLQGVTKKLEELLSSFERGHVIREGIATAIIGKPNVGKSTLMNALLGKDRSIVTDIPGTTRDMVEESALVGGLVLHLMDTAGIRQTEDRVEALGVERSRDAAEKAELVLAVFDGSTALDGQDRAILSLCKDKKVICIINKTDLVPYTQTLPIEAPVVYLSAQSERGIAELESAVREMFLHGESDGAALTNLRHKNAVSTALSAARNALCCFETGMGADMAGLDISAAAESLAALLGQSVKEQMIDDIFSRFCVGK